MYVEMKNCLTRGEAGIDTDVESINTLIFHEKFLLQGGNEIQHPAVFLAGAFKEIRDMAPWKHQGVVRGNRIFIIHGEGEIILHQEIPFTITPAENAVCIVC
jgi:hypothetical protein